MPQGLIPSECSRFDVVQAHYWWNVHHHNGQWSNEYARQCRIARYYRPGAMENGPEPDSTASMIYDSLCDKAQCERDRSN